MHSVEKREIDFHEKIFREINSLVTSLGKPLLSRNFCQKSTSVRENFRVEKQEILSREKIFREINSLVSRLVKKLLSRIFCQKSVRENFCIFHTVSFRT